LRLILLGCLLGGSWMAAGGDWTEGGERFAVRTDAYALELDARSGAPRVLSVQGKPAVNFGADGWWRLTFEDGKTLRAADAQAATERKGDTVRCVYTAAQARVTLTIKAAEKHFDLDAQVEAIAAPVTHLALPAHVVFNPETLNQACFPFELGRALTPAFFERQTGLAKGNARMRPLQAVGATTAGIAPAKMDEYTAPAQAVSVTAAGREWLGRYAAGLEVWKARNPRSPAEPPDVTLLETPLGALLSLQSVDGGWGYFIRWGGVFGTPEDNVHVRQASVAVALALSARPVSAGKRPQPPAEKLGKPRREVLPRAVGLVAFDDLGLAATTEWATALSVLGGPVKRLTTPEEVLAAVKSASCWLIANPYGELLPATEASASEMATAIRGYVTNGGVWLHTGGYPFYYVLEPQPFRSLTETYPPAFSDFLHVDARPGQVSVYGVQKPGEIFVPAQLFARGTEAGGELAREWFTWAAPEKAWKSPTVRVAVGSPVADAIREYGRANGFDRPLAEKVKPEVLPRLKRSLLVKYEGSAREQAAAAKLLPPNALVHTSNYLHGGFDKQYPDHLPVNPAYGTPDEFAALLRALRDSGRLYMPYTNPTWWCDDPPGPSFVRHGDAPLVKDRQGRRVKEQYSHNYGWSLCAFHPAALEAEKTILKQFTEEYPVDVLFQDQVGARSPLYDFNSASPTPYAYLQGMIDIAKRDSAAVPLSTENGYDGVLNYETQFCGITWGLVRTEHRPEWAQTWHERYPPEIWRFAPLALWLAHDKALFAHHDLGQFVTNREALTWTLALGYQLSITTTPQNLARADSRQWLDWVAALAESLGPLYLGAPLTRWDEAAPGVYRAQYGRLWLVANTTPLPYEMDAKTTLSGYGFLALSPEDQLTAGWLDRYEGRDCPEGFAFLRRGGNLTVYMPEASAVVIPFARTAKCQGNELRHEASREGLLVHLPSSADREPIPAECLGRTPRDREKPPRFVGLLDIAWMTPGWAVVTPAQWAEGLAGRLKGLPLDVKRLTSVEELYDALKQPAEYLAIVNPYGETFPAPAPREWSRTVKAVLEYTRKGGTWFETGGYPFYAALHSTDGKNAVKEPVGGEGLAMLGLPGLETPAEATPVRLAVTALGEKWLSPAVAREIGGVDALVNRPFFAGRGHVLVGSPSGGWLTGMQTGGWGWFWRLGGGGPPAAAALPAVSEVCRHLFVTPPTVEPEQGKRWLHTLTVE
jgi:hypothetical protein